MSVPEGIGLLQECDLCHTDFAKSEVQYNGCQFLCPRCRSEPVVPDGYCAECGKLCQFAVSPTSLYLCAECA